MVIFCVVIGYSSLFSFIKYTEEGRKSVEILGLRIQKMSCRKYCVDLHLIGKGKGLKSELKRMSNFSEDSLYLVLSRLIFHTDHKAPFQCQAPAFIKLQ